MIIVRACHRACSNPSFPLQRLAVAARCGQRISSLSSLAQGLPDIMKLAIPKERRAHERRVAVTPDTVKKLIPLGFDVVVESGAGVGSSITDDAFRAAGAVVAAEETQTLGNADIVLKVQRPL